MGNQQSGGQGSALAGLIVILGSVLVVASVIGALVWLVIWWSERNKLRGPTREERARFVALGNGPDRWNQWTRQDRELFEFFRARGDVQRPSQWRRFKRTYNIVVDVHWAALIRDKQPLPRRSTHARTNGRFTSSDPGAAAPTFVRKPGVRGRM